MAAVEVIPGARRSHPLIPACRRLLLGLLAATRRGGSAVTLLLATDAAVRRLNRRFRGRDRTTDVLSFPARGDLEPGVPYLGDLAISVPQAGRQARRAGWSLRSEMALLVTHGFLHLLGHDHESDDGTMRRLERDLLRRVAGVAIDRRQMPWGEAPPSARRRRAPRRTPRGKRRD